MIINDIFASYSLRDCIEWGFKVTLFLDSYKHLTDMHGAENVGKLVAHITEVNLQKAQ
jgi:hypothetical protein